MAICFSVNRSSKFFILWNCHSFEIYSPCSQLYDLEFSKINEVLKSSRNKIHWNKSQQKRVRIKTHTPQLYLATAPTVTVTRWLAKRIALQTGHTYRSQLLVLKRSMILNDSFRKSVYRSRSGDVTVDFSFEKFLQFNPIEEKPHRGRELR